MATRRSRGALACTLVLAVEQRPQTAQHVGQTRCRRRARRCAASGSSTLPAASRGNPLGLGASGHRGRSHDASAKMRPSAGVRPRRAPFECRASFGAPSHARRRWVTCRIDERQHVANGTLVVFGEIDLDPGQTRACRSRAAAGRCANSANARGAQSRTPPASISRSMMSTRAAAPSGPNLTIPRFSPSASAGSIVLDMSVTRPQRTLTFISSSPNSGWSASR